MEITSRRQRIVMTPENERRKGSRRLVGRLGLRPASSEPNREQRRGEARRARRLMAKVRAAAKAKRIRDAIEAASFYAI